MESLAPEAAILALFLGFLAPARPKHQAITMETIACSHMCIENTPRRMEAEATSVEADFETAIAVDAPKSDASVKVKRSIQGPKEYALVFLGQARFENVVELGEVELKAETIEVIDVRFEVWMLASKEEVGVLLSL